MTYDALLVVSFGGPEGPDEVMPFLENVTRGRSVPADRLAEVAAHYHRFGGVSPINGEVRRLMGALVKLLRAEGPRLPVYWGNRNWHPLLTDTVARMARDGVHHALAFVTSAFSSYSSCGQYLDDIAASRAAVGPAAPAVDKLRVFFNHPGFIEPMADRVRRALEEVPPGSPLLFSAHSIPRSMAAECDYAAQLADASAMIAQRADADRRWVLGYQSRSGPPGQPWLEPDISECLRAFATEGAPGVVLVPVGFVSEHLEVVYDLDVVARNEAEALHLPVARAATVGDDPAFVAMIRELMMERIAPGDVPPRFLGSLGVRAGPC
jgi:ferrochelatase